jgi:hypothetical protein
MDPRRLPAGMTEVNGLARHGSSGIYLGLVSGGYPPQTAGITEVSRHSRMLLAGIQAVFLRMDPR